MQSTATLNLFARRNLQRFRGAVASSEDADTRGFRRTSDDHGDVHNSTLATLRRSTLSWDIPLKIHALGRGPSSTTVRLRSPEPHGGAAGSARKLQRRRDS